MNPDILSTLFKYFVTPKLHESDICKLSEIKSILDVPIWEKLAIDIHTANDYPLRFALTNSTGYIRCINSSGFIGIEPEGKIPILEFLISKGADVHVYNERVLRYAVENNHLPLVELSVSKGADVRIFDSYNLMVAAKNGCLPILKFLASHKARMGPKNIDMLITLAKENHHKETVAWLLSVRILISRKLSSVKLKLATKIYED